ncbi:MAG: type I pantothenate kinase [Propionibacteriaceae bacterium]|nr:type I pantothenate kinase [Propionibacteriaceae bacterium]
MPDLDWSLDHTYLTLSRDHWSQLAHRRHLALSTAVLDQLLALGDPINLDHVRQVYLPLCELIELFIKAKHQLSASANHYLGLKQAPTVFIIGIAGSVAVGKSTTARLLQELLSRDHQVDLVTTDGFLWPNQELERRGLMDRKGFPESYDQLSLLAFVAAVKAGQTHIEIPTYSHLVYDIVPDRFQTVNQPEILIVEGLNVLQPARQRRTGPMGPVISDFFDFSIYVDAPESVIRSWFLDRFERLRDTAFTDPRSYFRSVAQLPDDQARTMALDIWDTINGPNLHQNILPTKDRATVVIGKGANHDVDWIRLRKA